MYINAVILITITAFTSCHCSWLYVQPFTYQETRPRLQLSATVLQTATHLQRNSLATIVCYYLRPRTKQWSIKQQEVKPQGTQCWNLRKQYAYIIVRRTVAIMTSQKRWLLCVSVAGGARGRGGQLIPAGGISYQEAKKGVVVERTFYRLLEAGNHPLHAMYRVSSDLETVINFLIVIFEVNRFQDRTSQSPVRIKGSPTAADILHTVDQLH